MKLPPPKLKIQLTDGTLELPLSHATATALSRELTTLTTSLKPSQPPAKLPPWEYQHSGEVFLEVFCNPNIWANPFVAKVLLTIRDPHLRCTLEIPLTQLRQDLEAFLEYLTEQDTLAKNFLPPQPDFAKE